MRKIVLSLCCLALFTSLAMASEKPAMTEQEVPTFIKTSIRAYRDAGTAAAMIAILTHNSPLEGSKAMLDQASILTQAGQTLGRFESYDVAGGSELTPRTRVFYLVLNYEKGPLFARFVVYRSDQDWVLTDVEFSFHDDKLFFPLTQ